MKKILGFLAVVLFISMFSVANVWADMAFSGQQWFVDNPVQYPVIADDPAAAVPCGFGTAANGGVMINGRINLAMQENSDVYLAISAPALTGNNDVYLFMPDGSLRPLANGLVPWRTNVKSVNEIVFGDIAITDIPEGSYTLYVGVTPTGDILWDSPYYVWQTTLTTSNTAQLRQDAIAFLDQYNQKTMSLFGKSQFSVERWYTPVITVEVDPNLLSQVPMNLFQQAADWWRENTGIQMNVEVGTGLPSLIWGKSGVAYMIQGHCYWSTMAETRDVKGGGHGFNTIYASVTVFDSGFFSFQDYQLGVIEHELWHVLGMEVHINDGSISDGLTANIVETIRPEEALGLHMLYYDIQPGGAVPLE